MSALDIGVKLQSTSSHEYLFEVARAAERLAHALQVKDSHLRAAGRARREGNEEREWSELRCADRVNLNIRERRRVLSEALNG